jgi:hypothetical protein
VLDLPLMVCPIFESAFIVSSFFAGSIAWLLPGSDYNVVVL